jgi:hypothetical protein
MRRFPPSGHLDGRAVTAGAVNVAPQRPVEFGEVGAREAPRIGDGVLAPERHVVHTAQDAAVRRLGEQDLLLPQIAERPRGQLLAAEFPPDEAGDQLARGTQRRCCHVGLEDREQRGRVGQQQARAPTEPQQVRVPVLRIRRRRRLGDRRAQDSQELSRAPQDHCAIVRRGAASSWLARFFHSRSAGSGP